MNLLLAIAVTGATYTVDWEYDFYGTPHHFTGVVDTQADTLTWDALPEGMGSPVWHAVTRGDWVPGGGWYWEILPYDVPDDWSGVLDGWGFISDARTQVMNVTVYAGLGCVKEQAMCTPDYCETQVINFSDPSRPLWRIREIRGVDDEINPYGVLGPALVDIQPVSPTRVVGDANLDGQFDSGDMVQVFTTGKYGHPAVWMEGDWSQDGVFDSGDMVAAFTAGGYQRPLAAVPEPSAAILLLLGLLCRRRRHV